MEQTLKPIVDILQECVNEYSDENSELYQSTVKLVINLMNLTQRKFYIPGETMELERLRQKSIDNNLFSLIVYFNDKINQEDIKQILKKEFFELLEENDYNYQFLKVRTLKAYFGDEHTPEHDTFADKAI